MSLKITSITRVNPAPCQHFRITVDDNGTARSKEFDLTQLPDLLDQFDEFPGGVRGALVLAWAIDRRKRGASVAQLINVEIESVI